MTTASTFSHIHSRLPDVISGLENVTTDYNEDHQILGEAQVYLRLLQGFLDMALQPQGIDLAKSSQ